MDKIIKNICVGHKPPDFIPPSDYIMLCPSSLGMNNELVISDERFGTHFDGASLAEYSQLFGLAELISAGDVQADALFLFQYRKFISPASGGYESVASWVKVLSPEFAADFFPTPDSIRNLVNKLVVGDIFNFGESISENYSRVHVNEDLVTFSAACAQSGKVNSADIKMLATMRGIIPSPALCYIETNLFLEFMKILQEVSNEFIANYYVKREGYQSRSLGYLLERLHSVLICQNIMSGDLSDVGTWNRYVINSEIK
jgi:hypothetical protein